MYANVTELVVKKHEARTEAAKRLHEIISTFPELLDEIIALRNEVDHVVANVEATAGRIGRRSNVARTAFERIAALFIANGNEWLDTSVISQNSGVSRNVAATVMWSAHREHFERRPHASHKKMKLWRLTSEAFDQLKRQGRLFSGEEPKDGD